VRERERESVCVCVCACGITRRNTITRAGILFFPRVLLVFEDSVPKVPPIVNSDNVYWD
jgi:hypothetical protein